MGQFTTVALTLEQYREIIHLIREGYKGKRKYIKGNNIVATALIVQANLGLRIGDIVKLTLKDFIKDGDRLRLDIVETKTGKSRKFTVPIEIYDFLVDYALENGISKTNKLFDVSERWVQVKVKEVCEILGYKNISTHSFRKYFATTMYNENNYDIALVQELLQHSNVLTTRKYIGISSEQIETALKNHIQIV